MHCGLQCGDVPNPSLLCYPPYRAEKLVAAALDDENEVSKPTAVCWVGERANCFAVGYDDGSILLYGVPKEALAGGWVAAGWLAADRCQWDDGEGVGLVLGGGACRHWWVV